MQGDIFQLDQMMAPVLKAPAKQDPTSKYTSKAQPLTAIYNEDDLSHLLFVDHHNEDRVIINDVHHASSSMSLESPLTDFQTPLSETNETPLLSDCESDSDETIDSPICRTEQLQFESDFPVFLGQQAEEPRPKVTRPPLKPSGPAYEGKSKDKHVQIIVPEEHHISAIDGPLMSWWPASTELMEHEWIETAAESANILPTHVSSIEGPMMTWWPAPLECLEHEWEERFYE